MADYEWVNDVISSWMSDWSALCLNNDVSWWRGASEHQKQVELVLPSLWAHQQGGSDVLMLWGRKWRKNWHRWTQVKPGVAYTAGLTCWWNWPCSPWSLSWPAGAPGAGAGSVVAPSPPQHVLGAFQRHKHLDSSRRLLTVCSMGTTWSCLRSPLTWRPWATWETFLVSFCCKSLISCFNWWRMTFCSLTMLSASWSFCWSKVFLCVSSVSSWTASRFLLSSEYWSAVISSVK